MRYWLANFPEQLWVEIGYSRSEHLDDQSRLLGLVQDIARRDGEGQFPKTEDERQCVYCVYRTLCLRRGAPGAELPDEENEAVIDPQSIPELEY